MARYEFGPLDWRQRSTEDSEARALEFFEDLQGRRSVRDFSSRPVPRAWIELAIRTAASAPSGANRQPWRFVAVSEPDLKRRIRIEAEAEEKKTYESRMSEEWAAALEPLGTDWRKPFLEIAPWLVIVFAEIWEERPDGGKIKNYYVKESVGIACGFFIAALHSMGLATLTHTPSPMAFLNDLLGRPGNEKPYILFPVGYPASNAQVPKIEKKALSEVSIFFEPSGGDGAKR
jgi:nitroreductase